MYCLFLCEMVHSKFPIHYFHLQLIEMLTILQYFQKYFFLFLELSIILS